MKSINAEFVHQFIIEPEYEDNNLSRLFKVALKSLRMPKAMHGPNSFDLLKEIDTKALPAHEFYQICLFEIYAVSLIGTLRIWKNYLIDYREKYNYSWEHYATEKRYNAIKEFGGEDGDYDENGNIAPVKNNEELRDCTIVRDITGFNNACYHMELSDICLILSYIANGERLDIFNLLESFTGKPIQKIRVNTDGSSEPISKLDSQIESIENESKYVSAFETIRKLIPHFKSIYKDLCSQDPFKDNKSYFENLESMVDDIHNLTF